MTRTVVTACIAVMSVSCSVALQPSVRSASVECSTSYGYAATDVVLAGGFAFAASRGTDKSPQPQYVPYSEIGAGVMAASALLGLYKRHNCVRWRETAPPEVWAEVAERHRREAEAQAQAIAEAARQQEEAQASCPEGTIASGDQCVCPDGFVWDGAQCVSPASAPAGATVSSRPQRVYVQNNTRNTTIANTTVNATVSATVRRPASSAWHASLVCAMYQTSAGSMWSRQQWTDTQDCSRFCAQKLNCACVSGPCG
jgi:hypothetical protein